MFFSSIKGINRLIRTGELQITQISLNFKTSCCNLKFRGLVAKMLYLFFYFNFKKNHGISKSKSPCILPNKNINFNRNEIELNVKNSANSFIEKNLVLQLIHESQIKIKTVMRWSLRKKKKVLFCTV